MGSRDTMKAPTGQQIEGGNNVNEQTIDKGQAISKKLEQTGGQINKEQNKLNNADNAVVQKLANENPTFGQKLKTGLYVAGAVAFFGTAAWLSAKGLPDVSAMVNGGLAVGAVVGTGVCMVAGNLGDKFRNLEIPFTKKTEKPSVEKPTVDVIDKDTGVGLN